MSLVHLGCASSEKKSSWSGESHLKAAEDRGETHGVFCAQRATEISKLDIIVLRETWISLDYQHNPTGD